MTPLNGSAALTSPSADLVDSILGPIFRDPTVTDIMVNDLRNIMIEKNGKPFLSSVSLKSQDELDALIEAVCQAVGKHPSAERPFIDGSLPDGTRVHLIIPPATPRGPCITFRRFPKIVLTLDELTKREMLDTRMARFLAACVSARMNLLISGGTSTGKTTLLNSLLAFIPRTDRIISIEDTAELRVQHANHVRMISTPTFQGHSGISPRDLLIQTLRMRPDRILLGECRGAEAFDMLQAMNTGHSGSMTTIHANTGRDALARLETLALFAASDLPWLALRKQIVSALDCVVHITRTRSGARRISSIQEITGIEGSTITTQDLFSFVQDKVSGAERFHAHGLVPTFLDRLTEAGHEFPPGSFG